MASFRKHKGRWTATVRIPANFSGPAAKASISETFTRRADARTWANATETDIKLGRWKDPRLNRRAATRWEDRPFRDTLDRYRKHVTPEKDGEPQEYSLIGRLMQHPLAEQPMRLIERSDIAEYRDERVAAGKAPQTVKNEVLTLSGIFNYAIADWGYELGNPVRELLQRRGALPKARPGRDRRLVGGEQHRLETALTTVGKGHEMIVLWRLLLDTGMRLGEALSIRASALRSGQPRVIVLAAGDTKTKTGREVIVSAETWSALSAYVKNIKPERKLFTMTRGDVEYRFALARDKAGVKDFRLHDLRHEALSRMAAAGLNIKQMMMQSGHKTPAMLMRYINPTIDERMKAFDEAA